MLCGGGLINNALLRSRAKHVTLVEIPRERGVDFVGSSRDVDWESAVNGGLNGQRVRGADTLGNASPGNRSVVLDDVRDALGSDGRSERRRLCISDARAIAGDCPNGGAG